MAVGMNVREPDEARRRPRLRMEELAGRLAPRQARFDRLTEANRRRAHLETLIGVLQTELALQNEEIRRQTVALHDEAMVELIRCSG